VNYLLLNHIPAHAGSDGAQLRVPRAWANELRSTADAMRPMESKLLVATPLITAPASDDVDLVELSPEEVGFEHLVIPGYSTAQSYLRSRGELADALRRAIELADVVQMDDGGHPVPLGLEAFDVASAAQKKRVFVFGRDDTEDRLRLVNRARRAAKRLVGHTLQWSMSGRLAQAVRESELVIAHGANVVKKYGATWDHRCHLVDRVEVRDAELLDGVAIEARRAVLLQDDRPLHVLSAGRQVAISGTDHVLRAVAKCRRLQVPVELTVAGDGQDLDFFRSLAWQLGLETGVQFVTDRQQINDAWQSCDVLASGVLSDHVPREVLLGVARGMVPVMYAAARTDEAQERPPTVGDPRFGEAIITVPRGDVDTLADRLVHCAGNRGALVQRMFKGLAWIKPRTVDASHRTRAALVRSLV
jgi:glycosyltransferase involved in cell wall biosynthesis